METETKAKHTPAPWAAEFSETGGYDCMTAAQHIMAGHQHVCDVDYGDYGQENFNVSPNPVADANARLIAAAPELLEACIVAIQGIHAGRTTDDLTPIAIEALRVLRAAIRKATSEGDDNGR